MTTARAEAPEALAEMVQVLCDRIREAEQREKQTSMYLDDQRARYERASSDAAHQRKRAEDAERQSRTNRGKIDDLEIALSKRNKTADNYIDRWDRITLALFEYIVELLAQSQSAKTKAERLALQHVVAKLAEIRPPVSKEEADAFGVPWKPEPADTPKIGIAKVFSTFPGTS